MKNLLNPRWIVYTYLLPLFLLLVFVGVSLFVLKPEEDLHILYIFGGVLVGMMVGNGVYAYRKYKTGNPISLKYCIFNLLLSLIYIYPAYACLISLFSEIEALYFFGVLFMPSIIYNLLGIVVYLTDREKEHKIWVNFLALFLSPVCFFFFGVLVVPLFSYSSWEDHGAIMLFILGSLWFIFIFLFIIFLFLRFVYLLYISDKFHEDYRWFWEMPFTLFFPMLGLAISASDMIDLFGNFLDGAFFVIAILTGILICLPVFKNVKVRFIIYLLRCIVFVYTVYFFIVFLPFFPVAIATLCIGVGFLFISPIILFFIHVQKLRADINYLKNSYNKWLLIGLGLIGFFILPGMLSWDYLGDKKVLDEALEYVYDPDYSKEYQLNKKKVIRMLDGMNAKGNQTPLLNTYYKRLVLGGMTLQYNKQRALREIFEGNGYGDLSYFRTSRREKDREIKLIHIDKSSRYDSQKDFWISQVDLTIENQKGTRWNTEYYTIFNLPDGCWISDYYLYVGEEKERGILAETRTANWIFSRIRDLHRDPGILTYTGSNEIEFKVFPFEVDEVRKTGIEFIHKEPVTIEIDGYTLSLGNENTLSESSFISPFTNERGGYISSKKKKELNLVKQEPYFHFIVDMSESFHTPANDTRKKEYIENIKQFWDLGIAKKETSKFTFTGTYISTMDWEEDIESKVTHMNFSGGFFLQRAIESVLVNQYLSPTTSYPVIVVISNQMEQAIITKGFNNLQFASRGVEYFYWIKDGEITSYPLFVGERPVLDTCPVDEFKLPSVYLRAWPSLTNLQAWLPDDDLPSIVVSPGMKPEEIITDIKIKDWETGLYLQQQWLLHCLYPKEGELHWLSMIQASFKSRIMTPYTSYIVVETELQKETLMAKQKQVLEGNRNLDVGSDFVFMSEPDAIYIFIALLLLFYLCYRGKKRDSIVR